MQGISGEVGNKVSRPGLRIRLDDLRLDTLRYPVVPYLKLPHLGYVSCTSSSPSKARGYCSRFGRLKERLWP